MRFNTLLQSAAVTTALVLSTAVAKADTMLFDGTTTGVFTQNNSTQLQGLSFKGGSFSGNTSDSGYVAFGGAGSNFGVFTLDSTMNSSFTSNPFQLTITFQDPSGISGGQNSTFSAIVTGSVTANSGGGATISFNPNSATYNFANSMGMGNFTLNLNNVSVFTTQSATVTGYIQSTVTPEPNSLMLLGTGFVSAAGMLMRRRKAMTA